MECTCADEVSRRVTGSMEAEWTEPTRRGPSPVFPLGLAASRLASRQGWGTCTRPSMVVLKIVSVVEVAVFPQHHYLDGGSIPSRGADEIPLF